MKTRGLLLMLLSMSFVSCEPVAQVQSSKKTPSIPPSVVVNKDIVFKSIDTLDLKLDIYQPNDQADNLPLLVWIHGGAWFRGHKERFIGMNNNLVNRVLNAGYALASVSYRLSQQATFPAQMQDCHDAIAYVLDHAEDYRIDNQQMVVMGRSAGGHLASLVATANGSNVTEFYTNGAVHHFPIVGVVDFFGPSDFIAMRGNTGKVDHDLDDSAEARLLGQNPLKRPDLAKLASPTNFVNSSTPPFLIIHGKADGVVPYSQSILLKSYLDLAKVKNKLIGVEGATHGDKVMDGDQYVDEVMEFLEMHLPVKR